MRKELDKVYKPEEVEKKWYDFWLEKKFFHSDENSTKEPYVIVIPPPNVTGILHMGHGLNNTLQDILIRWKRMQGYNALWVPGTDHAGIATQFVVEKDLAKEGLTKHSLGRKKFLEKVWEWKEKQGGTIIRQLKRLGCSCDWDRERFTMDEGLSQAVREVFCRLYEDKLIYRGTYIVNWCPRCRTALSDDEVIHPDEEVKTHLWYIKYPVKDSKEYLVVATTRPETMLGDTAVAMNPKDERYRHLLGKTAILPLLNRELQIIADDYVDMSFGTGLVKITPAHDPNDFLVGRRQNLPEVNVMTPDGKINENGGHYCGLDRFEARDRVVADLKAQGLLEKITDHIYSPGKCYRCDTIIEPYLSEQWFIKMRPLAEKAIEAVEKGRVRFIPKNWETTYFNWMYNVRDWCISRQLWWGHRIPVWYCRGCNSTIVSREDIDFCPYCRSGEIKQDEDVLDTWFSSALWPFSTLGWPERTKDLEVFYPTSVLVTAHEIIFFWVARMIMMGLKFMGDVPFSDVFINPIVCDEHGKKQSKSLGNAIDPIEMIELYGTDSLRFTFCALCAQVKSLNMSVKRIQGYRNFTNKIWNAARMIFMHTESLEFDDFNKGFKEKNLTLPDKWILFRYNQIIDEATKELEEYYFSDVANTLYHFIWHEFCDWYLELVKSRLFEKDSSIPEEKKKESKITAQIILLEILEGVMRLLHPIMPFITEEIWQKIKNNWGENKKFNDRNSSLNMESIMVAPWTKKIHIGDYSKEAEEISFIKNIIYTIRNIRGEMDIPPSEKVDVFLETQHKNKFEMLKRNQFYIKDLVQINNIDILSKKKKYPEPNSIGVQDEVKIIIPMPSELIEKEKTRLEKELKRLMIEEERLSGKLSNEGFLSKAPEEVVSKEKEKLDKTKNELMIIKSKLEKMN